ncbi:unnamed protein product [Cylicocyclus nassatus]|uniref:F-box associated domain-containing protein n=1 Tax=Cylicocyclus nassatus TaxID=53992 RepID=A0AA36GY86_CYLNA|nr:unnamed protein product [Cylicocyclus nassatus]
MRFMFLSKESHLLALQAKVRVERVIYESLRNGSQSYIDLSVEWSSHRGFGCDNFYKLKIFPKKGGGCVIHHRGGLSIDYEQDIESVGMQLLFHYTKLLDIEFLGIELCVISPGFVHMLREQLSGLTLQANNFSLCIDDNLVILSLIPLIKNHSSSILFSNLEDGVLPTLVSEVFDYESVRITRNLSVNKADLFDEQLCNLQASRLFVSSPHITSHSINYLIRQWFAGEREISLINITINKPLDWDELFNGIDPSNITLLGIGNLGAGGIHDGKLNFDHGVLSVFLCGTGCILKSLPTTNLHYE